MTHQEEILTLRRQLREAREHTVREGVRLKRDVKRALDAARAAEREISAALLKLAQYHDGAVEALNARDAALAENTRLMGQVERALSMLLVAKQHRDVGSTEAMRLEAEARSTLAALLGCGCIETYPQLRPGELCHGPGCKRASDNTAICKPLRSGALKLPK